MAGARRPKWTIAPAVIVSGVVVVLATLGILIWLMLRSMSSIRLVVTNASSHVVTSVSIVRFPDGSQPLLTVGSLATGEKSSADGHIPESFGSAWMRVESPHGTSTRSIGTVLDDDGPFEFRVAVRDADVEIERDNNLGTMTYPPSTQP